MWTKEKRKKRKKLSREILTLILLDMLLAVGAYFTLFSWGGSLAFIYCEKRGIAIDDLTSIRIDMVLANGSLAGAVLLFLTLFLIFVGKKLSYIRELTIGIDDLRKHRMDHQIPLKGDNELTELAESINYLAETERQLKAVERNLSHDIRTPLTAIMSYAEYLQGREQLSKEELDEFLELTKRKAEQIKLLTEQLLDGGSRLTEVEDGRLLIAQLAEEWVESIEDDFYCNMNLAQCPNFSRQLDVEEIRRIFDNLASNIKKYADTKRPVELSVFQEKKRIVIRQSNWKSSETRDVESRKIGITSIESVAKHHGGSVSVTEDKERFAVKIILFEV